MSKQPALLPEAEAETKPIGPTAGQYRVPAFLRGMRHVAAKEPDLFHTNMIYFFSKEGDFEAAATDGFTAIRITGTGDYDDTPEGGLLLPTELFAKCKARLDDDITIDYPEFSQGKDAVGLVTATWQQPQKDDEPDLTMCAGIDAVYGKYPDVQKAIEGEPGRSAPRCIISLDTAKTITETVKELSSGKRFAIRAITPDAESMCDVYFRPDPGLHGFKVRFVFRPSKSAADDRDWLKE